jgi:hypothetical protein
MLPPHTVKFIFRARASFNASLISDTLVLQSQNGTPEVAIGFHTFTRSPGLRRYRYITISGPEARRR